MNQLKVYQIGLGSFGRHGFEKLVEMHNHLESVDLRLKGLAEQDFEKREAAKRFAEANDIDMDFFSSSKDLYSAAGDESGTVMIYDASPSQRHAEHIYNSINHGFYHLAEKPPSMTREEHLKERKMAAEKEVFWKVDFIERENPVVRKAVKMVEDKRIDSIEVFRESSVGLQKMLEPTKRAGVVGGDILDKMTLEIYVLDLLEAADGKTDLDLEDANSRFFMPSGIESDTLMDIYGGKAREIKKETATGRTRASFHAGDTSVKLHSSWLGSSSKARNWNSKLEWDCLSSNFYKTNRKGFLNEETRFFVIRGEVNLVGDMLHGKLFDLDAEEKIDTPSLMHDQLYRVIRKAVESAAEYRETSPSAEKIDTFMQAVFDARDQAVENADEFFEELTDVNDHVSSCIEEAKVIEDSGAGKVTG